MFLRVSFLLIFINKNVCVNGANILGLLGMTSPSNQIWNNVLLHRLAELGHNVTVLSVDKATSNDKLSPNLHHIHLEKGYGMYDKTKENEKIDIASYIGLGPFETIVPFYEHGVETCKCIVASKGLQTLLSYPDDFQFDIILNDYTLGPYMLGFLHKFNYPPLVGLTAFHNSPLTIDAMSNHYFPAYVPYHSTSYSSEMSFWERLANTLLFIADTTYRRLVYLPKIDAIMRPYFAKDLPYLGDLSKYTVVSLVNSHPAIDYAESLPPNVIEVGGLQIVDAKPLPKDIDDFMNKGERGAIFISFGTNMKSEDFTEEKIQAIWDAISQLSEYNILWKFDVKYLKQELPSNVLVRSFFPQRDILNHPKIKAFVTHCGGLSSQEATWRGVPMVGIPLFLDQHKNLLQSKLAGIAEKIDFLTMTSDILRNTIRKVAEDSTMAERARVRSTQFRDRPMRPLDTAVWWVEYILRNPNPYHLKSPAAKLNILQANSLDCLLFILVITVISVYLIIKLVACGIRYLNRPVKRGNAPMKLKKK